MYIVVVTRSSAQGETGPKAVEQQIDLDVDDPSRVVQPQPGERRAIAEHLRPVAGLEVHAAVGSRRSQRAIVAGRVVNTVNPGR